MSAQLADRGRLCHFILQSNYTNLPPPEHQEASPNSDFAPLGQLMFRLEIYPQKTPSMPSRVFGKHNYCYSPVDLHSIPTLCTLFWTGWASRAGIFNQMPHPSCSLSCSLHSGCASHLICPPVILAVTHGRDFLTNSWARYVRPIIPQKLCNYS